MQDDRKQFRKDIKIRVYRWTIALVQFVRMLQRKKDFSIASILDQLLRAGTSVGANYIEAIGSPTQKDFRNMLAHSLKSANESKFWLAIIRDAQIYKGHDLETLLKEIIEISNILGKSVSTMYKMKA